MAMGIGGVIGQALMGGLQGAGNAAAYVGKSQYDSEMADKQAAADFQRKKDLMALQDEMAGARYQANATFDTSEGLERMKRDQKFKVDNNDTNVGIAVKNNSTLAAGAASDVSTNQPMLTDAKFQETKTMQPLEFAKLDKQNEGQRAVANITAGPHYQAVAIAQAQEGRRSGAADRLIEANDAVENAGTPEEKKAAQKLLIAAQTNFSILNGKSPGNIGKSENIELLKQASEYDKQIKDAREAALLLPKEQKEAAIKAVDRMVAQRDKIMALATGDNPGVPKQFSINNYDGSTPTLPAKAPNAQVSPPSSAASASPGVISQSIGAKPVGVPADMQAIKTQLDQETTKLKQLDVKQSGAVPKSQLSANIATQKAQQQIVDDLKVKLNTASEKLGSYPFGRF